MSARVSGTSSRCCSRSPLAGGLAPTLVATISAVIFCPALTKLALDLHVNLAMSGVRTVSGIFFQGFFCRNDQAHFALFTSGVARVKIGDKTGPLKEDDL